MTWQCVLKQGLWHEVICTNLKIAPSQMLHILQSMSNQHVQRLILYRIWCCHLQRNLMLLYTVCVQEAAWWGMLRYYCSHGKANKARLRSLCIA